MKTRRLLTNYCCRQNRLKLGKLIYCQLEEIITDSGSGNQNQEKQTFTHLEKTLFLQFSQVQVHSKHLSFPPCYCHRLHSVPLVSEALGIPFSLLTPFLFCGMGPPWAAGNIYSTTEHLLLLNRLHLLLFLWPWCSFLLFFTLFIPSSSSLASLLVLKHICLRCHHRGCRAQLCPAMDRLELPVSSTGQPQPSSKSPPLQHIPLPAACTLPFIPDK